MFLALIDLLRRIQFSFQVECFTHSLNHPDGPWAEMHR